MAESEQTASLMTPAKLARAGKAAAPVSPSAWLDRMAADAGHQHVHRLAELGEVLRTHARARKLAPLATQLTQLDEALPRLDFELLRSRGWWARTTGKGRGAGAEFASQFEEIDKANRQVAACAQAMQANLQAEVAATERTLVEFEVEYHALDKIVDQGARWLQDMREQLKARHAQAPDAQSQQQVKDDAARCEILVARLKLLQAASKSAQAAHAAAQSTAATRAALLAALQQALASDVKAWHVRLSALASSAGEAGSPVLSLEGPLDTHKKLGLRVKQTNADLAALQAQEDALEASLSALAGQLQPAG